MDLNELADRVEALAGPDRKVDALIAAAVGEPHGEKSGWANNHNGDYYVIDECARAYTASIDAAMTLVETGHDWMLDTFDGKFTGRRCSASVWVSKERWIDASGATPALALTAAALRTKALGAVHTLTEGN